MPRISQAYPSKNLSAADLNEQDMVITIAGVESQTFDDDSSKLVLMSEETEKGFVLNKTNAKTIAALYGDDTDDWMGKRITLYHTWVDFGGKSTEAIRVRPKPPREKAAVAAPTKAKAKPAPVSQPDDDEIDENKDVPF